MKTFLSLLIAAAAASCLATAINGAAIEQDLSVPFNDLLPPLLGADAATTTTATTATITTATTKATAKPATTKIITTITTRTPTTSKLLKATKKSYYQQQTQHIKDLHLIDEDAQVPHDYHEQEEHLQHLHAGQAEYQGLQQKFQQQKQQQYKLEKQKTKERLTLQQQQQQQQRQQSASANTNNKQQQKQIVRKQEQQVTDVEIEAQEIRELNLELLPPPQEIAEQQTEEQQHAAKASESKIKQHVLKPTERLHVPKPSINKQAQKYQQQQREDLQQYINYFQQTTRRPPKGALPTLTPFPRHLKL